MSVAVRLCCVGLLLPLVAAAACAENKRAGGGDGAGGNAGSGGAGGTGNQGGTDGQAGQGGTGGAGGPDAAVDAADDGGDDAADDGGGMAACFPDCIETRTRDCIPVGVCMMTKGSGVQNQCWSNDVKARTLTKMDLSGVWRTTTFKKPDGSICYSTVAGTDLDLTEIKVTWKDADGAVFATASGGGPGALAIECDSGKAYFGITDPTCSDRIYPGFAFPSTCTIGACTYE